MAAAKTLTCAFCLVALLAAVPFNPVFGQQTMQVAVTTEVQELLQRAESLLAANDSQGAYRLLEPRETEFRGNAGQR